jgi:hypothetical protein
MLRVTHLPLAAAVLTLVCACSSVAPAAGIAVGWSSDTSSESESGAGEDDAGAEQGRILWVGEEGDDLLVHAAVGQMVAGSFAVVVHYEMRFDQDGEAVYVSVVDEMGDTHELVRLAERKALTWPSPQAPLQYCYPFPLTPEPLEDCEYAPCAWDEQAWPEASEAWPDCLEVVREDSGATVRVTGAVDGTPFGARIDQSGSVESLFDVDVPESSLQRLGLATSVAADVATLPSELDLLDVGCPGCMLLGLWVIDQAHRCSVAQLDGCSDAYYGYAYWKQDCEGVCG